MRGAYDVLKRLLLSSMTQALMDERKRSAPYLMLIGKFFLLPLAPTARVVACTGLYQRDRKGEQMTRCPK